MFKNTLQLFFCALFFLTMPALHAQFTWDNFNGVALNGDCNRYPGTDNVLEPGETFTVEGNLPAGVASVNILHQVWDGFGFTMIVHQTNTLHTGQVPGPYSLTHTLGCDAPLNNGFGPPSIVIVNALDASGTNIGTCAAYISVVGSPSTFVWDDLNGVALGGNCNRYPGNDILLERGEVLTVNGSFESDCNPITNIRVRHQSYTDFSFGTRVEESFTDYPNPTSPFSLDHTLPCNTTLNNGFAPPSLVGLIYDFADGTADSCFVYVSVADAFTFDNLNDVVVPNCNAYPGITTLEQGETFNVGGTFSSTCNNINNILIVHQVFSDFSFSTVDHQSQTNHPAPTGGVYDLQHTIACDAPENNGFGPPSLISVFAFDASGTMVGSCSAYVGIAPAPVCDLALTSADPGAPFCPGGTDGTINIEATSSIGAIEYMIDGPMTMTNSTGIFSNLPNGSYTYTITVATNCPPACVLTGTVDIADGVDSTPPTITCPASVTIDCSASTDPADTGMPIATDDCDPAPAIAMVEVITPGACMAESTITRTWTVTDASGNAATCSQVITVEDTTAPVAPADPASLTIQCVVELEQGEPLTAMDDCGGMITVMPQLFYTPGECASRLTATRVWTFEDGCGNTSTTSQIINVIDDQPISIVAPADQTISCAYNVNPNTSLVDVISTCDVDVDITTSVSIFGTPDCPGSRYTVTYTAIDDCGRTATDTQVFTIANDGPEFVCPADICVIDCPADNDMIQANFDAYADLATVNTPCGGDVSITNSFSPSAFNLQNCNNGPIAVENTVAWQVVTFRATDGCGRNTSCTALVVIKDTSAPSIIGEPFPAVKTHGVNNQGQYDNWINANLTALSAEDGCNAFTTSYDLTYTPASPNMTLEGGYAITNVTFTATDACGNSASTSANFLLQDAANSPMATVAGRILTSENEYVENTSVTISHNNIGQIGYHMTDEEGAFEFDVIDNQNYQIAPSRNDDPLNGVTTLDLIMIGRHVLDVNLLETPYQLIAADVNNSGTISVLDIIALRRLILHIDNEFSTNQSWRFVDADFVFPNPANPFATTFPEIRDFDVLLAEIANFIAVKIGDVNSSAAPNQLAANGDTRDRDDLFITVEDQALTTGQTFQVDFKAKDFNEMTGFQFSLGFDQNALEFADVTAKELPGLTTDNFGFTLVNNGILTTSWNVPLGETATSLADDQVLFTVTFKVLKETSLSKALVANSEFTSAEAYNSNFDEMNVSLEFNAKIGAADISSATTLYQNRPNPFSHETVIGFDLVKNEPATLTIYDVSGKVVRQIAQTFQKGYNEVSLSTADLGSTGLMYYRLETSDFTATKKMIVIK